MRQSRIQSCRPLLHRLRFLVLVIALSCSGCSQPIDPIAYLKEKGAALRFDSAGNIQAVDLHDCPATDADLEILSSATTLTSLKVYNGVTDDGLSNLRGLTNLETLGLSGTEITDGGLTHLSALTNLQSLDVSDTAITDAGVREIATFPSLVELDLSGTSITDIGLSHLVASTDFKYLTLSDTNITDEGLRRLVGFRQLIHLTLDGTDVTDKGIGYIKTLPIAYLGIERTPTTDDVIEYLLEMPNLTEVFASHLSRSALLRFYDSR